MENTDFFKSTNTHPQQEGEFRIPVTDVAILSIGHIHQRHDHLTKTHEGAIDTAGLLGKKQHRQQLWATTIIRYEIPQYELEIDLESRALCVCVLLSLRPCQIHQVQLRCSNVHYIIYGLFGLQSHGEHSMRPGRLTVHGGGGHSSITPAHRQDLQETVSNSFVTFVQSHSISITILLLLASFIWFKYQF